MKLPLGSLVYFVTCLTVTTGAHGADVKADLPYSTPEQASLKTVHADSRLELNMSRPTIVMSGGGYQPYLFATSRGTLFCQAQLDAEPFNTKGRMVYPMRIGTAMSRDQGATWQRWTAEEKHDDVFIEGGAIERKNGSILLLDTFVTPTGPNGALVGELWQSSDDLKTLHGPTMVPFSLPKLQLGGTDDDAKIKRDYARLHRSVIEMPNGDLLALVYSQFTGDTAPSAYLATMFKSRNVLVRSRDGGKSWAYVVTIGVDGGVGTEGFDEGTLVRVSTGPHTGRLLTLFRTGRDLYGSHSDDDGLTWTHPKPVEIPGVDIYDTAKWEKLFVDPKEPGYVPTDEMIGNLVDPDLIQMRNGALVCAVGVRTPARKSLFQNWRAPENGNYLIFSLDGGDTWSHVVQYTSGLPTTHYAGVREIADGLLYVVYDNSIWEKHLKGTTQHDTLGFKLAVKRVDR